MWSPAVQTLETSRLNSLWAMRTLRATWNQVQWRFCVYSTACVVHVCTCYALKIAELLLLCRGMQCSWPWTQSPVVHGHPRRRCSLASKTSVQSSFTTCDQRPWTRSISFIVHRAGAPTNMTAWPYPSTHSWVWYLSHVVSALHVLLVRSCCMTVKPTTKQQHQPNNNNKDCLALQ